MTEPLAADRLARRAAQTVFDRPLLLEAGAGTGKTTTLVARALAWCIGPGWQAVADRLDESDDLQVAAAVLQGVVAITFTEAAAAEMAARLAQSLALVVDDRESEISGFEPEVEIHGDAPTRRKRAERLLEFFDHLSVSTIHAFCYGLLTEFPLEAGLHPELRIDADGSEIEVVARAAVERWTQEAYTRDSASPFLLLARHGFGPGEILEASIRWLSFGTPTGVLDEDPLAPERADAFLKSIGSAVDTLGELLHQRLEGLSQRSVALKVGAALRHTAARLTVARQDPVGSLSAVTGEIRELWPPNLLARLREWSHGKLTKEEAAHLDAVAEPLRAVSADLHHLLRHAQAVEPERLDAGRRVLAPIVRQIERDLRSRGVITFSGLLRETRELLRRDAGVVRRVRQRLRLLLVDEFQDTDPLQAEIIHHLALGGDPADCPSLFVVGDPKQSIYGWRSADLAAYQAFEERLLDCGGERHPLSVNFRSAPEVLAEVERVVAPVMVEDRSVQPPFQPLHAHQRASTPSPFRQREWREIEYWVSWSGNEETERFGPGPSALAARLEARELALDVHRLHTEAGVPWADVAVLFRTTTSQPVFLDALRRYGIPFAVNRDRNYFRRREVIDAAAWVRTILNPADHLALLTALRSAVAGVPDAALIPLWTRQFPQLVTELRQPDDAVFGRLQATVREVAETMPEGIPGLGRIGGWDQALLAALASLARLRTSFREDPPDRFIRRFSAELLLEGSEAARFQGKFRLANLRRFLRQLESAMENEESDVHSILRSLRLGVHQGRPAEEAMPRDAVEDAVQVMTIHTAKGLEFPHVYLVQMHSGTRRRAPEKTEAHEVGSGDWQYRLFGAATLGFPLAESRRQRVDKAEAVRTLYVAMTRAARRLVLIGSWPESPQPGDPARAGSHIDLLQSRTALPRSLGELANDPAVQLRGGHHDQDGIRWRFLAGGRTHGSPPPPSRQNPWLPTARRLDEIAASRRQRIRAAERRAGRRLIQPVTLPHGPDATREADIGAPSAGASPALSPAVARRVGTAMHRCLERWDLHRPAAEEAARQRRKLHRLLTHAQQDAAWPRLLDLFEHWSESTLLERLVSLRRRIIGRELPVLVGARSAAAPEDLGEPVGGFTGTIDLLYRDPDSDLPVVADFKTDELRTETDIARRLPAYARQQELYAHAVREAFGLDRAPRTELWLLWADRIWTSFAGEC